MNLWSVFRRKREPEILVSPKRVRAEMRERLMAEGGCVLLWGSDVAEGSYGYQARCLADEGLLYVTYHRGATAREDTWQYCLTARGEALAKLLETA